MSSKRLRLTIKLINVVHEFLVVHLLVCQWCWSSVYCVFVVLHFKWFFFNSKGVQSQLSLCFETILCLGWHDFTLLWNIFI